MLNFISCYIRKHTFSLISYQKLLARQQKYSNKKNLKSKITSNNDTFFENVIINKETKRK